MATTVTRAKTSRRPRSSAQRPKSDSEQTNGKRRPSKERLRPGQLDALVLAYMKKHRSELPLTPTKVAQGINRSSGAVANCLGRLEKEKKVRRAGERPRRYDLTASTK